MKLKECFISREIDGQQVLAAAGEGAFSGLIRANRTAAFIINCLRQDTTEDAIILAMLQKYSAPKELIAADVHRILDKLKEIDAIEE